MHRERCGHFPLGGIILYAVFLPVPQLHTEFTGRSISVSGLWFILLVAVFLSFYEWPKKRPYTIGAAFKRSCQQILGEGVYIHVLQDFGTNTR